MFGSELAEKDTYDALTALVERVEEVMTPTRTKSTMDANDVAMAV
jgi:hypothetical protein